MRVLDPLRTESVHAGRETVNCRFGTVYLKLIIVILDFNFSCMKNAILQ